MKTNKRNKKEEKFRAAIRYYPVAFRWKVIQQLEAELLTDQQACKKYGISLTLIRRWRRQYFKRRLLPHIKPRSMKPKQSQAEQIKALEKQLEETQKALQEEKLKSRAYEIMVEEAEKEFNIPVRKKSGPKQSHD